MPMLEHTITNSTTSLQCSQSYISMGNPSEDSPMILDSESSSTPVAYLDVPEGPFSPYVEGSTASMEHDQSQDQTETTDPLPQVDGLIKDFFSSIVISDSAINRIAERKQSEVFKPEPRTLAIRRGALRLHDLRLPTTEVIQSEPMMLEVKVQEEATVQGLLPITPLDQMIPNPIVPPPAPKPRQTSLVRNKSRVLSSTSANMRTPGHGQLSSPKSACGDAVSPRKRQTSTSILDMAAFPSAPKAPSHPLLSPIRLTPNYPAYRPDSSPLDSDFELYGFLSTPMSCSPTKGTHAS